MNKSQSIKYFQQALKHIPGGVNSPVRAFKAVGGDPIFMQSAHGAYLKDVDGQEYIDLINSWGPMILGHANEHIEKAVKDATQRSLSFGTPTYAEVEMAELICHMMPSVEKVRMVNSGTEATMSAIRLARGYTKRNKIIKFEGCYHGHSDSFLIAAGSGVATLSQPDSPGVTPGTAQDTLTLPFNDLEKVKQTIAEHPNEIAAIILEPIAGNMGCVPPRQGYLKGLRTMSHAHDIVLIFDEVMTGFRIAKGGAQQHYGIMPDLTTMGKIIGGGMPVGAYGGRADIMDKISPQGPVYQAGTLSGNPVAMAAGRAMLTHLNENEHLYQDLAHMTQYIVDGIRTHLRTHTLPCTLQHVGSMFSLFFTPQPVHNFDDANTTNPTHFAQYFNAMLTQGIYLAPSPFETLFISTAITQREADQVIQATTTALSSMES